jgi:hypothetical protein
MYDFSRQRMAARCFRCMLILLVLTIGWLVLKPPPFASADAGRGRALVQALPHHAQQ